MVQSVVLVSSMLLPVLINFDLRTVALIVYEWNRNASSTNTRCHALGGRRGWMWQASNEGIGTLQGRWPNGEKKPDGRESRRQTGKQNWKPQLV